MSAWIVMKGHIDCLVQESIVRGLCPMDGADLLGQLLWEENRYSVAVRYPRDADGEWPGPIGLTMAEIHAYEFEGVEAPLDPKVVLHQLHCWQYQCAEFSGWDERPGNKRMERLEALLVAEVGEHGAGVWGIDDIREAVVASHTAA